MLGLSSTPKCELERKKEAGMKVWITKYALTKGIFTIETEDDGADGMITDRSEPCTAFFHGEGRDWHRSEYAATRRADEMKKAKIAALVKATEKLRKMQF
jgi:hypothetical protein